ncbi:MAG TPA: sigma-E factor negative regulatory protein [Rhodanobacteraceae bacterium]
MKPVEHENLSALADGELGRDEVRFMLRRTEGNAGLRAVWTRYHVIGASLRHESMLLADNDFATRVMQQIAASAPQLKVATAPAAHGRAHHWLRWSAGGAIAAGVAAVALIMVQPQMQPAAPAATGSARIAAANARTTQATTSPRPMAAPAVPRWLSASPSAAQLAQPAAADFYGPGQMVASHGYAERLSPYMTLPTPRATDTRQARHIMYELWTVAPQPAPPNQRVLRLQRQ